MRSIQMHGLIRRCGAVATIAGGLMGLAGARAELLDDPVAPPEGIPVELARTLRVPSQYPTIQAAVNAAMPGDTVLVAPGTYTGAGNRDIVLREREGLVIRSEGGAAATILDAQGTAAAPHRHFDITGVIVGVRDCVIEGFTLRSGRQQEGGSIRSWTDHNMSITIRSCIFQSNRADFHGGAIFLKTGLRPEGGDFPVVKDCQFLSNVADGTYTSGGYVYYEGRGGAIYASCILSLPEISGNRFESNRANLSGGGLYLDSGAYVLRNVFKSNQATWYAGGGAYIQNMDSAVRPAKLENNVFIGNASPGAALPGSEPGYGYGGGLEIGYGAVHLSGCTFYGNTGKIGQGLHWYSTFTHIHNSIFWGAGTAAQIVAEAPVGGEYFRVESSDVKGGYPGAGNINADPRFVNAAAGDLHLAAGSPCIDAADGLRSFTDIEGRVRVDDPAVPNTGLNQQAGFPDMGAYERQVVPAAPEGFAAQEDPEGVLLTWTSASSAEKVVGYQIYRSSPDAPEDVLVAEVAGAPGYLDPMVGKAAGSVSYRIRAVGPGGAGDFATARVRK